MRIFNLYKQFIAMADISMHIAPDHIEMHNGRRLMATNDTLLVLRFAQDIAVIKDNVVWQRRYPGS